jgi:predicted CXXCH cytochrome family protein
MRKKSLFLLVILVIIISVVVIGRNTKAESSEGCVTGQCHSNLLKGKDVHPVAEGCDTCHQEVAKPHPQKGKKTFKLMQDVPALCYMCHTPFGKKPHVHPPVKDGMCTTCHNPHSSDQSKLLVQPLKDLCLMCHPDKVDHKYVHGPTSAGDCTACHNPHESDNDKLVLKKQPDLCLTCHVDMANMLKKKDVHPALLMGCTACHNPHGSSYKKMLSAEGEKLCFQCHPQIAETIEKAKVVHAPIKTEKACVSCHSPHASDSPKLLPKTGKDLCLTCHKDIITSKMTVLHGPIRDGSCTACHSPHGSPYFRMLKKEFPSDFYVSYSDKEFELCFSCHNRDLLRFPDTMFATGFRDGNRNLHYLHVNREFKGRSCVACHNVHGGTLPKLLATQVEFGKWSFSLNYQKTDTGGSCQPGCHKRYSYDRKAAPKEIAPGPVKQETDKGGK